MTVSCSQFLVRQLLPVVCRHPDLLDQKCHTLWLLQGYLDQEDVYRQARSFCNNRLVFFDTHQMRALQAEFFVLLETLAVLYKYSELSFYLIMLPNLVMTMVAHLFVG